MFSSDRPRGLVIALLAMITVSGVASLTYQVVWMRRLALVFGSTTLATSTVLVAFLGGLAIGAAVLGRVADGRPVWTLGIFGLVEAATGVYALASPWIFRALEALYLAAYPPLAARQPLFIAVQFILSSLVIVPPAILMGGSVPLLARRLIGRSGESARGVGALYGWNTVGAALGAGLAAYGLLPALGMVGAVRLAAAGNLLIGAAALLLDARARAGAREARTSTPRDSGDAIDEAAAGFVFDPATILIVLQGFALSGFAVIAYEVAWTRLLALVMGSSVYAYGALVVVVLLGLGLGSALYSRLRLRPDAHLTAFGFIELLIGASAAASLLIAPHLPFLFMRLFPVFKDAFAWQIGAQIGLAMLMAFVPALLSGATFPAVIGCLGGALARLGRTIGTAYAANTAGTVLGAFLAGFVLIPAVGLRATIITGVAANLLAGVSVLLRAGQPWGRRLPLLTPAAAALVIVLALPPWPREVFAAGVGFFAPRYATLDGLAKTIEEFRLLYYRDGINTTISVDEVDGGLVYRSNGKTDASTFPSDMANQLLLGHIPLLLHEAPRDVFILGLGTGVTAAAVAQYPVRRIDIVELEPAAVEAARFFDRQNRSILNDPRVRLLLADGRNRLRAASDRYDVVISDPSDLWVAGIGSLFTIEFYEAARARLRAGGLMVQWIHTHSVAPADLALLVATFRAAFPQTEIWTSGIGDLILLGAVDRVGWDYARLVNRIEQALGVREDLQSIGIWHPAALFAGYVLGEDRLAGLVESVRRLHVDDRPVLEFSTPRSLYADTTAQIEVLLSRLRGRPFPTVTGFDPARDLDADGTYLLGFAYASLGQPRRGIPHMERSTRMAPDRPAFFIGLANQYREVGRPRDAEDAYGRALALDPNNVEALTALGEVLLEAGRADRALRYAERALRLAPSDERAKALAAKAVSQKR
ncbi:MAG: fused MFS/spermidine synthase [Armatimonadota bacterium]